MDLHRISNIPTVMASLFGLSKYIVITLNKRIIRSIKMLESKQLKRVSGAAGDFQIIIYVLSVIDLWFMQLDLASTWWFLELDVRRELDRTSSRTLTHTHGKLPVATPLNSLWRFGSSNQFINLKNYGNLSLHYEIHAKEEYTHALRFICLF